MSHCLAKLSLFAMLSGHHNPALADRPLVSPSLIGDYLPAACAERKL